MRKACAEYLDALGVAAETVLGPDGLAQIEAAQKPPSAASPTTRHGRPCNTQLQRLVLDGIDADQVLRDEAMIVRRDPSRDLAAILASRIDGLQRATGPLPWLPPVPRQVTEDDFWGRYFDRRHELIQRHGTAVRAAATSWTPATAPAWAAPTLGDPSLTRDLATWRAAHDIPDTDLRPTGPPATDRAGSITQRRLDLPHRRSRRTPDHTPTPAAARLAETIHPGITADPHWPTLAHQIAAADRAGVSHAELHRIATDRPLPIEQPAAALAYRLIDAISDRPPGAAATGQARPGTTARTTATAQASRAAPIRTTAAAHPAARLRPHERPGADHPARPPPVTRRLLGALACHFFVTRVRTRCRTGDFGSARRAGSKRHEASPDPTRSARAVA